jgi:hypothetical protein
MRAIRSPVDRWPWAGGLLPVALVAVLVQCDVVGGRVAARDACGAAPAFDAAYRARGLSVQECPGSNGYKVLVVSSDERSWVDLVRADGTVWSAEEPVVYDRPIGQFPNVDPTSLAWIPSSGLPTALVFKVTAEQFDEPEQRIERWYVVRVQPPPTALVGRAQSAEEARALAAVGGR